MPVCERECQEEIEKLKNLLVEKLKQADLFEDVGSEIADSRAYNKCKGLLNYSELHRKIDSG